MVSKTSFIAICLGMGLALGDAPKPNPSPQAKPKVIDLDFTDDGEEWTPAPGSGKDRESGSRWIYWTAGAVGVGMAAAGGIGWYLSQDRRDPGVTRNEQVFTDDR